MDTFKFYFVIGCCIVYFLIGWFGNIISILIFNKKKFKKQPTTTYLISLNVLNIPFIHLFIYHLYYNCPITDRYL